MRRCGSFVPGGRDDGEGHSPIRCAFTEDGLQIVSGERKGKVRLWQTDSGELRYTFDGSHGKMVTALTTSPRGRRALAAWEDGKVRLYDLGRAAQAEVYEAGEGAVRSLAFSPDGRHFASGGYDGTVAHLGRAAGEARVTFAREEFFSHTREPPPRAAV